MKRSEEKTITAERNPIFKTGTDIVEKEYCSQSCEMLKIESIISGYESFSYRATCLTRPIHINNAPSQAQSKVTQFQSSCTGIAMVINVINKPK